MTPSIDWNAVALAKLSAVLGASKAHKLMASLLKEIGLKVMTSADDLHAFAEHLIHVGGFAGAVGGLLSVHAVIHGARGTSVRRAPEGIEGGINPDEF